jgi:hypothetical protein
MLCPLSPRFPYGLAPTSPVGRGRDEFHRGPRAISTFLCELDGGDRPLSIVAPDRNSQAVQFVKRNRLHGPAFPSVRTKALPTSSVWACSNSLRISDARPLTAGMRCSPPNQSLNATRDRHNRRTPRLRSRISLDPARSRFTLTEVDGVCRSLHASRNRPDV